MAKTLGWIFLTWLLVIGAYILLAATYPGIVTITNEAVTDLQATSNLSNYPGLQGGIQGYPFYVWFIPGGIGVIVTAIMIHNYRANQ